jgi:hypothetical protein
VIAARDLVTGIGTGARTEQGADRTAVTDRIADQTAADRPGDRADRGVVTLARPAAVAVCR